MLDLFEKITLGFASFCGFLTLGLYLNLFSFIGIPTGIPSTNPPEFLRGVVEEAPPLAATGSPRRPKGLPKEEEDKIRALLKKQGQKVSGPIIVKRLKVEDGLYEHVSAEANWPNELQKAHSRVIATQNGDTRLQLFNIEEDSSFKLLGLQEKDIVEVIDGEIMQFSDKTTQPYYRMAKRLLTKLREGDPISITVTRKSRPVHLQFSLNR